MGAPRPRFRPVLVVGGRHAGKTSYARLLVGGARAAGARVAGFYSQATWWSGVKARFHLHDLADPSRRLLLGSIAEEPGLDLRVGSYHLSSATFAEANRRLEEALHADLICLDEIGPLELRGGGFAPGLRMLAERYTGILVVTVRPRLAERVQALLAGNPPPPALPAAPVEPYRATVRPPAPAAFAGA
jgi:nucleoside-triphosphatase THEP1